MKISVIIPAHNTEQYIGTAIESCLSQTYAPSEIIVVDDGSTDCTAAKAESYPSPVRVIRLPKNIGVSGARNRGAESATGNWLAFVDSDDWILPELFERQMRCATENEHAMLIYAGFFINMNGVETVFPFYTGPALEAQLRYRTPFSVSSVVYRREAFDAVDGFDPTLKVAEDWDIYLRLAARFSIKSFVGVNEPLSAYRVRPGSLSADAMQLFESKISRIESRCLYGKTGLSRIILGRKISAFHHYDSSVALRDQGSKLDLRLMLKSLTLWPFPWSEISFRRYKIAAVMAKQHLFKRVSLF